MQEMQEMSIWSLGLGTSTGEGNGNPLLYSCLENPMDRGAWWAAFRGVAKRHNWATEHAARRCLLMSLEQSRVSLTLSFREMPSETVNWPSWGSASWGMSSWRRFEVFISNIAKINNCGLLGKNEVGLTFLCFHEFHYVSQRKKRICIIPSKCCKCLDKIQFSSLQSLNRVWLFVWPFDPLTVACQASLFITNAQSLLKLMSIELVMSSNHLPSPVLLPLLFPSIRVFSSESILHIRCEVLECTSGQSSGVSASASIPPMNSQDWFPLGLISLVWFPWCPRDSRESLTPQFKSINSLALSLLSAFFIVQLSHPYMTPGKIIALITIKLKKNNNQLSEI